MTGNPRPWLAALALLWAACQSAAPLAGETYGPIRPGENLWRIVSHIYPSLERDRAMLALLRANPDAVTPHCNVQGSLKVGALLALPVPEQIAALDPAQARQILAAQGRDWAAHRRGPRPQDCPSPTENLEAAPIPTAPALAPRHVAEIPPVPTSEPAPGPPVETILPPPLGARMPGPADTGRPARPPVAGLEEGPSQPLAPGPRAPGWLLAPVLLGLLALTLVGWERQRSGAPTTVAFERPAGQSGLRLGLRPGELVALLLLAALVGCLGAAVTVLFREAIRVLEWALGGDGDGLVELAENLKPWQRLLLPAAGGLVAGLILQEVGGRLRGRTSTDYMEAVALGDGWISARHSLVRATSSLVTVASGGSIGREGAMVQLAAMVASVLGRLAGFPRDRLRLLVAAGAAAGLAAAYKAPIAATLFVAEIVLGSIALEYIGPLIVASVIASVTVHDLLGYAPAFEIPPFTLVSDWELGFYLLLGLAAGHLAPIFLRLLEGSHHGFARLPFPLAGRLALGGLVVGVISAYEPQVWGNGYSVIAAVLHSPWAWQALLTVLLLKMLATAATHGSGAIGGAFTPTLFVGALLGALFGTLVHAALPAGTAPPSAYAVVGMGAMLAATTHAPLMAILMVLEMTMDYPVVLPLMLAVVTAHYTARGHAGIRPMYAESLLPREAG